MVAPAAGKVVLVPFPFSNLSQSKLRPAIVLADAGRQDWILCQVTSKPYGDTRAVLLNDNGFEFNQIIDAVVTLFKSSTNRKNEAPTSTA